MIRILESWNEVGKATHGLAKDGLPGDPGLMKNWDLAAIRKLILSHKNPPRVLDMGAGGGMVLRFLSAQGLKDLWGVDLTVSIRDRARQWKWMLKHHTIIPPWHLYRRDLTKASFPDHSFDFVTCVSVIEHGVAWEPFFREAHRLLKPQGRLYVSVDYWDPKIDNKALGQPAYGFPWNIFDAGEIRAALGIAARYNFELIEDGPIPPTEDAVVYWMGHSYTFLSMSFEARKSGQIAS